jgi:hypothetical protein
MARIHVDRTGYPAAACRKAMRSPAVLLAKVERLRYSCGCCVEGKDMCHKPSLVLVPCATSWVPYRIVTLLRSNVTVQPASHNGAMAMSDTDLICGKRWTRFAWAGRKGRFKEPVWVEVMVLPSGSVTCIGEMAGRMSVQGPSMRKK